LSDQHKEKKLYETVLEKVSGWGNASNLMFVVGATQASDLAHIRTLLPDHFLLVPGVGAQGGSLQEVANYGWNRDGGLLVNASRAIIFASGGEDFAAKANQVAQAYHTEMKDYFPV
jgi:orotidine-5'-phosphate decarboxylase